MDRERIGKGEKEEKGKKRSATPCGLAWPKAFKRARNYARRRRVRASLFSRASPSSLPSPHRPLIGRRIRKANAATRSSFRLYACRFTHTGWPGIYFRVLYIILTKGGNSLPLALRHVFDVISSNFVIEVVRIELDRRGIEKERISTVCC